LKTATKAVTPKTTPARLFMAARIPRNVRAIAAPVFCSIRRRPFEAEQDT
jgi:hypothetical protein